MKQYNGMVYIIFNSYQWISLRIIAGCIKYMSIMSLIMGIPENNSNQFSKNGPQHKIATSMHRMMNI